MPMKHFLADLDILDLDHPPYSPDLALVDYFLFPKLKTLPKGTRFQDINNTK